MVETVKFEQVIEPLKRGAKITNKRLHDSGSFICLSESSDLEGHEPVVIPKSELEADDWGILVKGKLL